MAAELAEKTVRYEELLADAVEAIEVVPAEGTPLYAAAEACDEMAVSYLADGRHFCEEDDLVNALAAFSYGHGWVDAGVRIGVLVTPGVEQGGVE